MRCLYFIDCIGLYTYCTMFVSVKPVYIQYISYPDILNTCVKLRLVSVSENIFDEKVKFTCVTHMYIHVHTCMHMYTHVHTCNTLLTCIIALLTCIVSLYRLCIIALLKCIILLLMCITACVSYHCTDVYHITILIVYGGTTDIYHSDTDMYHSTIDVYHNTYWHVSYHYTDQGS